MKIFRIALFASMISISLTSCFKQSYDNPPDASRQDPNLPCNVTIGQLSAMAQTMASGAYRTLGDSTIYGIVTADDRSGNFYKQIVIQDSTGGMTIAIAQTYLYTDYPIGRKVYIKLKGLTLVNYKSLPEICFSASVATGSTVTTGIPSTLESTYLVKASYPNTVVPTPVTMIELFSNANKYLNMLVKIDNMEFDSTAVGVPYAPSSTSGLFAASLLVRDCPFTASMVMYNSAYATFQTAITPSGKGSMTGIFSIYNTPQFLIRDTSDIALTAPRTCP